MDLKYISKSWFVIVVLFGMVIFVWRTYWNGEEWIFPELFAKDLIILLLVGVLYNLLVKNENNVSRKNREIEYLCHNHAINKLIWEIVRLRTRAMDFHFYFGCNLWEEETFSTKEWTVDVLISSEGETFLSGDSRLIQTLCQKLRAEEIEVTILPATNNYQDLPFTEEELSSSKL